MLCKRNKNITDSVNKIIIRSPNWVGDVVMATPAFRCIRENFPNAKICILLKSYVGKLIDNAPWFDEIVQIDENNSKGKAKGYTALIMQLRRNQYDLGILFPNSFSSAALFWLAGVRYRIGYKRDARNFLLTKGLNRLKENGRFLPTYMADYYLRLCSEVGCTIRSKELELFVTEQGQKRTAEIFEKYRINNEKPFILFNPGAAYGSSKCWTAEGFARTADIIQSEMKCNIAVVCAPHEVKLGEDIKERAKSKIINLAGNALDLEVLKSIIQKSDLLISVDSGPRHIAVAFKKPVITLMGPNDPRYSSSPSEIGEVIRADVDCLACQLKVCPKDHRCMIQIKPEKVAGVSVELIRQNKR
ncbi:MAG: lipopolysaccharide heptosyltransferase II [Candidatus Kuenenia sp.]|nr:lipopolysaccharide heptosyltransferase II [Candidatus Kuenenia hertensis]